MILKTLRNNFIKTLIDYYAETEIVSFFNLLSADILKMQRIDIAQNLYAVISGKKQEKFQNAVNKLKNYIPIQYIIGNTEFYNLTLKVNAATLIPRPETEELVAWIINDQNNKQNISILDVGTGSGCIAIALAKNLPEAKVFALDVSEKALRIARQNAVDNGVTIEFIEADIFDVDLGNLQFDVIVSNPPYVRELEKETMSPNVLNHEPHLALFVKDDDPLLFYRSIVEVANNTLKSKGFLYFEINEFLGNLTRQLVQKLNYCNIELKKDLFMKDRMIKANKK
ncbi:peptide chain release factor N(5)-glutamine methyltransferase [Flavobacteriaceae bacterium]|jgi:release factor glutamine methyltransferase|nr:peptide chain release factor N(5)-glutamine methyltransferase [Flavobacteriaceae bacterium]MDB2612440.1 peptide chain release factor N(5)-glutamine methyltransferase [Flavobacteriaceae bacterium]MDC3242880.1 peptide chain release factor N(5)-glutamine methyltransferase [Flavobacteriaceae bacterium]